jgi:hypothetical protein
MPIAPPAALLSVARLCAAFPSAAPTDFLPRLLPHATPPRPANQGNQGHSHPELTPLLSTFGLDAPPRQPPTPHTLRHATPHDLPPPTTADDLGTSGTISDDLSRLGVIEWEGGTTTLVPCGAAGVSGGLDAGRMHGAIAELDGQSHVWSALLQVT